MQPHWSLAQQAREPQHSPRAGDEMPSAASATAAGEASGETVPSGGPPEIVPQHDGQPWVAATAKAAPVLGIPAAARPPCEHPDAQASQTPGDTTNATMNRSVWVTRAARPRSVAARAVDAVRATTANTRSSLLLIEAGFRLPAATLCRAGHAIRKRRPCQSVTSSCQ
jgi:hypothetical protein